MPALEKDGGAVFVAQCTGGGGHFPCGPDFAAEQHGRLVKVRRHDIRQRQEFALVGAHGIGLEQGVPAAGNHDRINDQMEHAEAVGQFLRDDAQECA